MLDDDRGFWFVWNQHGNAPSHKHDNFQFARNEAERLARLNRGQRFIVLQSVAAFVADDVQRIDLKPADYLDEIPF